MRITRIFPGRTVMQPSRRRLRFAVLVFTLVALAGCDVGVKQLGPTEYGIRFRALPVFLGGGVGSDVEQPGQLMEVLPWEEIYVLDSRIRNIEWGERAAGTSPERSDFVETRALDGNEVSLAVRIQYSLSRDPEKLVYIVQNVGTSNEAIEKFVVSAARADIRTHMNKLKTSEFFNNEAKYRGESEVRSAMAERLQKHGIIIQSVNLKEHRFERTLPDGTIDRSYQERINQVQTLEQETERERLRRATVVADKSREYNNAQAEVNRAIEDIEGYKQQAQFRGDGYYEAKTNEAKAIRAEGEAYVTGLRQKIDALSGPGGKALLKLEIAKSLLKSNPKFVVTGGAGSKGSGPGSIDVRKTDTNALLEQIGVFEALADTKAPAIKKNPVKTEGKNG